MGRIRLLDPVIEVVRTQQLRLLGAFTYRDTMDTDKILEAIESAKSRILANISPETLKEITDAVTKKVAKKSKGDRQAELRNSGRRA